MGKMVVPVRSISQQETECNTYEDHVEVELEEESDHELWKTAIIDRELHQLGINIAALSKMRLSETGSLDEVNYHFCWSGKPDNEPRIHGVGFAVKKSVLSACTPLVSINERIMWLDVNTNSGTLTLLSIYGPTLDYSKQQKDGFFFQLEQIIKNVPARNRLAVLGDFNAHKKQARLTLLQQPTKSRTLKFKEAKAVVQKATRECAQKYWQDLCKKIQICFEKGDLRGTYDGIKEALGPTCKKTANLKAKDGTILTDRKEQLDRWTEHYKELYSKDDIICDTALAAIPQLPMMQELDQTPTLEDVEKAIKEIAPGKAAGNDQIPPELLKAGGRKLASDIHALLCTCWEESHIPQDLKDAKIITLYKNKGDRADYNNYRGISLLSVVGKVLARVMLKRLQVLAESVYPEIQCGFRAGRSTTDMSFTLCLLQEKSCEQQAPLHVAFVDLQKAFDMVSRNGIYKILSKIGCPQKVLSLFKEFHEGMKAIIQYEDETSSEFSIDTGMKQGCVLVPTSFGIFFSILLKYTFGNDQSGILIESRMDGSLFNIR
nr:PREDICTED: uncharacterized protein LOC106704818 [Latimeria chalumnae]|eukprot:XP_014348156.1 PREDICTED: uncharacterized protein LOC106704818 [Latimeria chalumnae]